MLNAYGNMIGYRTCRFEGLSNERSRIGCLGGGDEECKTEIDSRWLNAYRNGHCGSSGIDGIDGLEDRAGYKNLPKFYVGGFAGLWDGRVEMNTTL